MKAQKTFQDMVASDRVHMVFSGIKEWEVDCRDSKGSVVKTFYFEAVLKDFGCGNEHANKNGYEQFTDGHWQIFHEGVWVGEAKEWEDVSPITHKYIRTFLERK